MALRLLSSLFISLTLVVGCASDDPAAPTTSLDCVFTLADASVADYSVDRIVVTMTATKTVREIELAIGTDKAVGTVSDLSAGTWTVAVSVYSSRLLLATGEREQEIVSGASTLPLDFVDWSRLFPAIPRRILFIGHSHTLANGGLDVHFAAMVNEFDPRWNVSTDKVAFGGWGLDAHWNDPAAAARDAISDRIWDAVVLHGSIALLEDHATYTDYAGRFATLIRAEYAAPWLIMNWAPPDMAETTQDIATRVEYTSRAVDAEVSPLGLSWYGIVTSHQDIDIFSDSAGHPSPEGTQLAVCTLFASLFGISPAGGSYVVDDTVSAAELAVLQDVAWNVVEGP